MLAYQTPVELKYVATTKSTAFADELSTGDTPPTHLKLEGQVIVRPPVLS